MQAVTNCVFALESMEKGADRGGGGTGLSEDNQVDLEGDRGMCDTVRYIRGDHVSWKYALVLEAVQYVISHNAGSTTRCRSTKFVLLL